MQKGRCPWGSANAASWIVAPLEASGGPEAMEGPGTVLSHTRLPGAALNVLSCIPRALQRVSEAERAGPKGIQRGQHASKGGPSRTVHRI